MRPWRVALAASWMIGCTPLAKVIAAIPAGPSALLSGIRIVSPADGADTRPAELLARLERADVVFFGEQHDDAETHRAEAELLDAIGRTGRPVIVSLEMFERDVQPVVDDYLAGRTTEREFLAREQLLRDDRRLTRLPQLARFREAACLEDVNFRVKRGLDRSVFVRLAAGDWIRQHEVVLFVGPTGTGKTWLACALGHSA